MVIRGSMVALFESEVYDVNPNVPGAFKRPNRKWGFHSEFAAGNLPPGTPTARSFRSRNFEFLSESQYAAHVQRIKSYY